MKLKNLFKKNTRNILLISAAANLLLLNLMTGFFDMLSFGVYLGVALLLPYLVKSRRINLKYFAILGLLVPAIYNGVFLLLGMFDVNFTTMIFASLQQMIMTLFVALMYGVKK